MMTFLAAAALITTPCLIVGDETAKAVSYYKPECAVVARPEATSATLQKYKPYNQYRKVYISIGQNGYLNPKLLGNLEKIRKHFKNSIVTWIVPRNSRSAALINQTAHKFRDRVVSVSVVRPKGPLRGKDYAKIAAQL